METLRAKGGASRARSGEQNVSQGNIISYCVARSKRDYRTRYGQSESLKSLLGLVLSVSIGSIIESGGLVKFVS